MPSHPNNHLDFSVVIPTYNRSLYLPYAISSILRQKNVTFEIIVCDDDSTDTTSQVVKSFHDKRIRYVKNTTRLGSSANGLKCFLMAKGDYIFTLGDDDFILDDDTLVDSLSAMKIYDVGIGRMGAIGYETTPSDPYQVSTLCGVHKLLKPKLVKNILTKSIGFGLGFYSGIVFDRRRMNINLLKMDHKCYVGHMCWYYHVASYDLIKKYGIVYIPKHFIVGRLSLDMIPRYFDMKKQGRLFLEDPIVLAKKIITGSEYEDYKNNSIQQNLVMLPNIKYYTCISNYLEVLRRLIYLDNTLQTNPNFFLWAMIGFMPNIFIKYIRLMKIYLNRKNTRKTVEQYDYFQKISLIIH
jgi:glycosyltransferase involved in cell wall biosynthesis